LCRLGAFTSDHRVASPMATGGYVPPPPHMLRQAASEGRLGTSGSGRSRGSSLRSSGQVLTQLLLPGGGRTQGAVPQLQYRNESSTELSLARARAGYDPKRHGWHDARGMAHTRSLASHERLPDGAAVPGSWAWTMTKARNHIGAGINGIMDSSDVCSTMVSGDSPLWFTGVRTVDGPFNCKAVPVRRCPKNYIDGKQLRVRARRYEQGDCLDITEYLQDTSRLPTPAPRNSEPAWLKEFRGHQVNGRAASRPATLVGGGCAIPAERMYVSSGVTRERFDPGNARTAGKQHCDG